MSRHRGAKHRRQYELSSGISLFNHVYIKVFNSLFPCIATRFRLYHQPTWLSGTHVRIIVSVTHLLVVEPSYYYLWHYSMLGCGLTLRVFPVNVTLYAVLHRSYHTLMIRQFTRLLYSTLLQKGTTDYFSCYPQRSFYSLSDSHSIMYYRITIPYLRTCSTCRSCS